MIEGIDKVVGGRNLTSEEAQAAMKAIMTAQATEAEIAGFLVALRMKGETAEEISAFASVMRDYALKIQPKVASTLVDMCGTGGDGSGTFNISTAASFVVAAAGVPVAKHGNRGISSKSGSADVLEALGARIDLQPDRIRSCIEEVGIGFMFAPIHHPAMRNVMPVRKQLAIRTVFNMLGPLTNPAGAKGQLMGVYDPRLTETLAESFRLMGHRRALVVSGHPGLDELSVVGATKVSELMDGKVRTYTIEPGDVGLGRSALEEIRGGSPMDNAATIRGILSGDVGGAKRDIVLLNAAGGYIVGGLADDFREGVKLGADVLESGAAIEKLDEFIAYTRG